MKKQTNLIQKNIRNEKNLKILKKRRDKPKLIIWWKKELQNNARTWKRHISNLEEKDINNQQFTKKKTKNTSIN